MEINKQKKDDIIFLELNGRLDTFTSKDLTAALEDLITVKEQKLLIDLAQLNFISSLGLRVLLTAGKTINKNNGKLALCTLKDEVKEIFDIAGFNLIFNIFDSQEEAINHLKS